MAFEKWKRDDGCWGDRVVTVVAICGVLLLVGLYYVFTHDLDKAVVTRLNPTAPPATTTGTAAR